MLCKSAARSSLGFRNPEICSFAPHATHAQESPSLANKGTHDLFYIQQSFITDPATRHAFQLPYDNYPRTPVCSGRKRHYSSGTDFVVSKFAHHVMVRKLRHQMTMGGPPTGSS